MTKPLPRRAGQAILLTTSREPTRRIRTFCRDFSRSVPNTIRVNRGKLSLDGVTEKALDLNADRIIVVDRWKGGPGKIGFFRIKPTGLTPVPPSMHVAGIKLQREFGKETTPLRSLAVTAPPESPMQVVKIAEFLSNFLDIPLLLMKDATLKFQAIMNVSLDASRTPQITFLLLPQAIEVGPCIKLSRVAWEI